MPRATTHAKIRRARGFTNELRENARANIDGPYPNAETRNAAVSASLQDAASEETPAETKSERIARLRAEADALEKENAA
jgi:hypothetical protein